MRTTSCVAYGLTAPKVWLYSPSRPNAASSALTARISGTTAATTAPKATSRIRNVAGRLIFNAPSRSSLTSVLIWSLVRVMATAWMA